jgi:predicted nucleic acid-binding protein
MPAETGRAVVADASAVAAVAFGEPSGRAAADALSGCVLHEPDLLPYELASVALRKTLRSPEHGEGILQGLALALALDVQWVEVDHLAVVRLAREQGVTTNDATYLHLAVALGIPLMTLDSTLARAARARGVVLLP